MPLYNNPGYPRGIGVRLPDNGLQIPNFGEGPVGDTIVGGNVITEAQRRADALRMQTDTAFADQQSQLALKNAAVAEQQRIAGLGTVKTEILARNAAAMQAEQQKFLAATVDSLQNEINKGTVRPFYKEGSNAGLIPRSIAAAGTPSSQDIANLKNALSYFNANKELLSSVPVDDAANQRKQYVLSEFLNKAMPQKEGGYGFDKAYVGNLDTLGQVTRDPNARVANADRVSPYDKNAFVLGGETTPNILIGGKTLGELPAWQRQIALNAYKAAGGATYVQSGIAFTGNAARIAKYANSTKGLSETKDNSFSKTLGEEASSFLDFAIEVQAAQNEGKSVEDISNFGSLNFNTLVKYAQRIYNKTDVKPSDLKSAYLVNKNSVDFNLQKQLYDFQTKPGKPPAAPTWYETVFKNVMSSSPVEAALSALSVIAVPSDYMQTVFYAAREADSLEGGNLWDALRVGAAALIGRIGGSDAIQNFIGGSDIGGNNIDANVLIAALNSREKRGKLGIPSIGEWITQAVPLNNVNTNFGEGLSVTTQLLQGKSPYRISEEMKSGSASLSLTGLSNINIEGKTIDRFQGSIASAAVDGLFTVGTDPVMYLGFVGAALKGTEVLEFAARTGRAGARFTATVNDIRATNFYASLSRGYLTIEEEEALRTGTASMYGKAIREAIKPTGKYSADFVRAASEAGRTSWLGGRVGQSLMRGAEAVIVEFGDNASRLQRTIKGLEFSDALAIAEAAASEGTEAAVAVFRQALIEGRIAVKIPLRRQLLTFVDGVMTEGRPTLWTGQIQTASRFATGKSVPFILGASPIRPGVGGLKRAVEALAVSAGQRIGEYGNVVSTNVEEHFGEILSRMAIRNNRVAADVRNEVIAALEANGIDTTVNGIGDRILRLLAIAEAEPEMYRGLDITVISIMSTPQGQLSDDALLSLLNNLDAVVEHIAVADEQTRLLGQTLLARFADVAGPEGDLLTRALWRVRTIGQTIIPRIGYIEEWFTMNLAYDANTVITRGTMTELRAAERDLINETKRLLALEANVEGITEAQLAARAVAMQRVADATSVLTSVIERKLAHIDVHKFIDGQLKEIYETAVEEIRVAQNSISVEQQNIRAEIARLKVDTAAARWEVQPDGSYREVNHSDRIRTLNQKYADLVEQRAKNVEARRQLSVIFGMRKDMRKKELERWLEGFSPLEEEAAQQVRIAREGMQGRSVKEINTNARGYRDRLLLNDQLARGPMSAYAQIRGINPTDISDEYISRYIEAAQNLEMNGLPVVDEEGALRMYIARRQEQTNALMTGDTIIGPIMNTQGGRAMILNRMNRLPGVLREYFINRMGEIAFGGVGSEELTTLAREVETFASNPAAADALAVHMTAELDFAAHMGSVRLGLSAPPGVLRTAAGKGAKFVLSLQEKIAPRTIAFSSHPNIAISLRQRMEDADRIFMDMGFDSVTRVSLRQRILAAQTPEEILQIVREAQEVWAIYHNLPSGFFRNQQSLLVQKSYSQLGFYVDQATGELRQDVVTLSQRMNQIPVMKASDMRYLATQYAKNLTEAKALADGVQWFGNITTRFGTEAHYAALRLARSKFVKALGNVNRFWHKAIVTGTGTAAIGGIAGIYYGDPLTSKDDGQISFDKLFWAGTGALMGSFTGIRYMVRIAGIEEGLMRNSLARGFGLKDKLMSMLRIDGDLGGFSVLRDPERLLGDGQRRMSFLSKEAFVTTDGTWMVIGQEDKNFVDAWLRILNRQINPDHNVLDRIILENWDNPNVDWRVLAETWLSSPAGNVEYRMLSGGLRTGRDITGILDGYEAFINAYLPTEDIRMQRVARSLMGFTKGEVQGFVDAGLAPELVHAENTWKLPRFDTSSKTGLKKYTSVLRKTMSTLRTKGILEIPSAEIGRGPMIKGFFRDEFAKLTSGGMQPEMAQFIAEQRAQRLTNGYVFRMTDESRFAKAVDIFSPFMAHRMDFPMKYAKLVIENQSRALVVSRVAAVSFNAGKDSGVFYQDAFGEWRMRIPGSGYLSNIFGGPESGFDFSIRSMFFGLSNPAFAVHGAEDGYDIGNFTEYMGESFLPVPGGPFWTIATVKAQQYFPNQFRAVKENAPGLYDLIFPFGVSKTLGRNEATRLWETFAHSIPPWEILDPAAQQDKLDGIHQMVYDQLLWEHHSEPDYVKFLETDEGLAEVQKQTSLLLAAWSLIGSVTPAPTRPIMPGQEEIDRVTAFFKEHYGNGWVEAFSEARPDLAQITFARGDVLNKDISYSDWIRSNSNEMTSAEKRSFHITSKLSIKDYAHEMAAGVKRSQYYAEYDYIQNIPFAYESDRREAMNNLKITYKEDFETYDFNPDNVYAARKELARIVANSSTENWEDNIDNWRREFGVDVKTYSKYLKSNGAFRINPWTEARTPDEIRVDMAKGEFKNMNDINVLANAIEGSALDRMLAGMTPAEQVLYLRDLQSLVASSYNPDSLLTSSYAKGLSALSVTEIYSELGARANKIYKENRELGSNPFVPKTGLEQIQQKFVDNINEGLSSLLQQKKDLTDAKQKAFDSKDWSIYSSLKTQLTQVKSQLNSMYEGLYKKYPDLVQMQADIEQSTYFATHPLSAAKLAAFNSRSPLMLEHGAPFLIFGLEELSYNSAPVEMKQAINDELVYRLNLKAGETVLNGFDQKLYWETLTPFQKDMLENMSPIADESIEYWKGQKYVYSSGKSGGSGSSQLDYAYSLMKQYSKRPAGAKAPAAYAQYTAIPPSDGIARSKFLKEHPEVAEWVRLGPMANMPPLDRLIVTQAMVQFGKWDGDIMSTEEITNLAWAEQQLQTWSRRVGEKPDTYSLWVNMPTGADKAAYLREHPEIKDWIAAGPMANMPDSYKEIVQTIMEQYGQWSTNVDPLSEVIDGFYKLPKDKRTAYLNEHPELTEYWKAIRTPEEQRMSDAAEQYFALPAGQARTAFASTHPELMNYFETQRSKRYERFLNKVAFFMGSNPSVFQEYITNQQRVIEELVRRFGQKPLLREGRVASGSNAMSQSTSGRVRSK